MDCSVRDRTGRVTSTPKADGWRMPAEYELLHTCCWMKWPKRKDTWRLDARPVQEVFIAVAEAISQFEDVKLLVDQEDYECAKARVPSHIPLYVVESDDCWMRDIGPTFLLPLDGTSNELRGVHWNFNAWGGLEDGLYFPWDKDQQVGDKTLDLAGVDPITGRYKPDLILEGGSIHVDGEGTLLTSEQCLLNPNRNPSLNREQIEEFLKQYCNVEKILWLGEGIYNDETDGHIDNMACFVRPGCVLLAWSDDPSDPQYKSSSDAFNRLSCMTDAKGRKLEIHKISKKPLHLTDEEALQLCFFERPESASNGSTTLFRRRGGERLAASYVNFYISQGVRGKGIIVPLFNDPEDDQKAMETLQRLFPDRKIVGIPFGREILLGGGNIHCITQQQPTAMCVLSHKE